MYLNNWMLMSPWISVEDRLPEQEQLIDIYLPFFGRITDITYKDGLFWDPNGKAKWIGVTHWMSAPGLPEALRPPRSTDLGK